METRCGSMLISIFRATNVKKTRCKDRKVQNPLPAATETAAAASDDEQDFCRIIQYGNKIQVILNLDFKIYHSSMFIRPLNRFVALCFENSPPVAPFKV